MYEKRTSKHNGQEHYRPLGMFVAIPADAFLYENEEKVVYQAIVLKQALDDIKAAYGDEIQDIESFTY